MYSPSSPESGQNPDGSDVPISDNVNHQFVTSDAAPEPHTAVSGRSEEVSRQALTKEGRTAALKSELIEWGKSGVYPAVDAASVPSDPYIFGSYIVYRRKLDGSAKACIVLWGQRDKDKEFLHGDSQTVSFEVFRLVQSIAANMKWEIGQMDVEAAFL